MRKDESYTRSHATCLKSISPIAMVCSSARGVVADDDGEPEEGDADAEGDVNEGSGSTFKLRPWKQRRSAGLGATPANGVSVVPMVDRVHHLMHLWAFEWGYFEGSSKESADAPPSPCAASS
jgi:hypothetical protein